MTTRKSSNRLKTHAVLLLTLCTVVVASACSNTQKETEPEVKAPIATSSQTTNNNAEPSQTQTSAPKNSVTLVPEGVTITKLIKEITIDNKYVKKIELLSDGGKLVTISNSNGEPVIQNLEYDGIIKTVDGNTVNVELEKGKEKTLTIPDDVVIEDEDNLGLKSGVEIEWVYNSEGKIESVELDN
jgi:ABC-type Fe3+-hydroxamate transport system substrate-binding protein